MYMRTVRSSPTLLLALFLAASTATLGAYARVESEARARERAGPEPFLPDLNSAPERHLLLLPGIGPGRARAIVEERVRAGPFASVSDLARVRGIGPATAAALSALVRAGERPRASPGDPTEGVPWPRWPGTRP